MSACQSLDLEKGHADVIAVFHIKFISSILYYTPSKLLVLSLVSSTDRSCATRCLQNYSEGGHAVVSMAT